MAGISPEASRAARGILRWSTGRLASEAKVGPQTVIKIERGEQVSEAAVAKVIATFTAHGIEVLGEGRPGARLDGTPSSRDR